MKICPVCNKKSMDNFDQPIEYDARRNCHTVFVLDKNNVISALDVQVEYNPNYNRLINFIKRQKQCKKSS